MENHVTKLDAIIMEVPDEMPGDIEYELLDPIRFILMREQDMTMTQMAPLFGVQTRKGLNDKHRKWIELGYMERAYKYLAVLKLDEIKGSVGIVMSKAPDIIQRAVDIALADRTNKNGQVEKALGRTQLEAIEWLWTRIIKPYMDKQEGSGASERGYAAGGALRDFNPMNIIPGVVKDLE